MAKDKKKRSANYIGAADELVRKAKADPEGTAASVSEWESSQREQAIQDRAAREIAAKNLRSYIQRHPSFSRSQKDATAAVILRETTDINAARRRENIGKAQREIQSQNELTSNPYAQAMRKTMLNQERARLDSLPGFSVSELDALDDDERNRRITDWAKRSAAVDRGLEKTNQSIDAYNAAMARQRNDTEQEELNKYINNPTAMVARMTMLNQERARLDSLPSMTLDEAMDYGARSAAVDQGLRQTERNLSAYDKAMERLKLQRYGDTVRENADFTEYSRKGASAENPDNQWQAVWTGNRVKNPVTYARAQAEKPKNAFARFMDNAFNYGQSDSPGDIQRLASYMTRDEVNVYNYLWAKDQENGTSDASKYFTDLTKTLFERQSEGYVEGAQKWSTESAGNSALASGTTVLRSPANGVAYLDALATKAQGKRIDPSSATQVQARVNIGVRGAVANEISDTVSSGTGSQFLGDATSFLYQTGLSIADSALNTAITGGNALASSALMGGTAATSAMQEALDGGASDTQALAVGGLAGFFEAFFERFSIENFLKMSSPAAKGSAIMNLLRQMGIEASEELGTEVADIVSEYLVMRDISQYKDATPGEIAQQIALAALGGALSGGVMGGTGLLVNNIQSNQIGKAASRVGVSDSVILDALNSNDPSARALAQQMLDGEAKTNSQNVGKLYASLAENGEYSNYDTEAILRAAAEEAAAEKQQKKNSKTAQRQTASQNAQNAPESVSAQEQTNRTNTEENAQQTRKQPRVDYATNVVDNEETDITGIHSVEDGTVYVQAGDNVVALNDVEFANADIGELYERAGKYGTEAAQRFVKAYDGGSVEQYAKGFDAMYRAARDGVAYDTALQQSLYVENYLSEDQRMQAYAAGQSTSSQTQTQVATNQEQVATEQQVEKPQNTEVSAAVQTETKAAQQVKKAAKPGLTRSYARAELTSEQRSAIKKNRGQLQVVDTLAKKYGREVVLVGSLQGMEINGQTVEQSANGVFDPSSGRIYIAADAQDGAFAYVAMHELAHSVRAASESDYNALQTTVFDALTKNGQNVDDLVKYQMDTFGYSEDVAREEVVANSAATVLTDEEFVRNLYNNEHSLFEQIRKFFNELAETFKQLTQSASWSQDAALTPENVRAIAEVFDRVAADTAYAERENAVNSPQNKFNFVDYSEREKLGWEGSKSIVLYENDAQLDRFVQTAIEDKSIHKKLYFGKIPSELSTEVFEKTGVNVDGYNFTLRADEIRKILKDHGQRAKEANRGQQPITQKDFARIPTVVLNPDNIKLSDKLFEGKPVILFEKEINGRKTVVAYVTKKHMDLTVQTMYFGKEKGSRPTTPSDASSIVLQTSETLSGNAPITTVAEASDVVKGAVEDISAKTTDNNSDSGIKLSVKDVEPADAKKLQRENDKLKSALENARAQLRLTDGMQVDEKAVTKLARGIVTDYSSKADVTKLSSDLYQLFNYASHSPDTDAAFSELNDIGIGLARQVIEQSQQVDTSVSEQFSDLKDYLKSTPIRLTDAQKEQIAASYGSLANFRKEYRGTIKISNDGVALDTVIGEMAESYPFLYDGIQGGDLIETLTNAADVTKPQIVNPYYMDMDGAAADLWLEIQQRYTDTPMVQTYADKQKAKLVELKQQQKQQIKDLRQQAKDEMDVALQIAKERAQRQQDAAVRGERQKQQVKTEKLKAKNQQLRTDIENERIANAINRALASKRYAALKEQRTADLKTQRETIKTRERVGRYKDRIKAAAMTLSAWNTSPSDKRFVPEGLRRAVSDFVSAIDMGFKEGSKVSENWKARMRQMQIAVENAQRSSPDVGMATWDQETVDNLASLTALIEGNDNIKSLRDLSEPQLKALADVLNGIKHEVINANKMFVNGRRESLSKAADSEIERMGSRKTGKVRKQLQKIMDSKLMLGNTKPIFLMDSLGGEYERIGRDLFNGRTEAAFILRDSKDFHSGLKKRYHVDKWLDQKGDVLTLNTEFGDTIRLSRGQALDVYEMYQREQQDTHTRHLADGGIVFKTDADGKRVDDTTAHPISDADIQKITSWLTDEQIAYADALVRYMSTTLAEAGNKTSLTLSGYKKYTGQHYVPFNSASDYIAHGAGQADGQQTPRLKNWGHGKSINAFANNPVVVESIDQIFGNHAEEMAKYAGLAIPQDNMIRYLNYKQPNEQGKRQMSMKSALRAAYGDNVVRYIDRFNADVGGKITADVRDQEMGPMLSRFKKGAVLASMSVVVQQPTAYFRAFSLMNPKYMRLGWTGAYQEAQQYAGTAIIKDIGGFDMQTSRGAADWILDKKPTNPIGWTDKVFGTLPEKADAVTWGALWNSVKAEIHGETGLAMNSEALLKAAGKRFDEVIDFTQVYDSTFSRSDWMRSKSKFGSMVTSFMAEPTTSMNVFMYSLLHIKDKNYSGKVHFIPATLALAATTIINAAVKAVVYAARDDDDYETFWEKYLAQLKSALFGDKIEGLPDWLGTPLGFVAGSDFSVFTQIPLVSDVMELAQGYDVTRTDMNVVGDVVDAALGLFNEKKTVYTKVKNLIGAVGNLTGLPVKNLWRDVESVVRLFGVEIPAATGGTADGYAKLYETIASGDDKRAEKLRDTLEGKGKSSKDIDTGVAKSLMENDERIRQAYEMKAEGDIAGLEELRAELAETYGEEVVDKAIKLYENSLNSELKKKAEALLESESRIAELYDYSEKGETPNTAKEEALREQLEKQYGKELVEKALSVYSEQFDELDSALYTADDMEMVGTLAFESGKTADLKTVVAEMEKDSKANDPKKSVLDKAVTAFKPLYTEALDKGYAQKAARIKKVLLDVYGSYGMTEEKIDKWLPGEKAAALYEAVDAGASVQSLNKLIKDAKAAGQKDSNIINRISSTYKEKMLEAWQKGDTRTYNQIASLLKNLNLYDSKGKLYYTDERFKDWQMAEKYDDLPEAVRAGDAGAVKQYVANLKKDGYSDGQITQRVSTNVHDELVEAYLKGDMSTYNKLKAMLQSLDLHDKRGNQYYPDSKIAKWIKDAQEKK
jgi:hypothetical protein